MTPDCSKCSKFCVKKTDSGCCMSDGLCYSYALIHAGTGAGEAASAAGWTCVQLMMMMCSSRGPHTLKHTNTGAIRKTAITRERGGGVVEERGAIWRRAEVGAPGVNAPWRDVFQRSGGGGGAGGRTEWERAGRLACVSPCAGGTLISGAQTHATAKTAITTIHLLHLLGSSLLPSFPLRRSPTDGYVF